MICSRCDRGHRYCTGQCATDARLDSLKRASKKYQSTRVGRFNNAARQQRYRQREQQIVTHQSSQPDRLRAVLKARFEWLNKAKKQEQSCTDVLCHHCGAVCDPFLRQAFIHQSRLSGSFRQKAVFGSSNANR